MYVEFRKLLVFEKRSSSILMRALLVHGHQLLYSAQIKFSVLYFILKSTRGTYVYTLSLYMYYPRYDLKGVGPQFT